jgi:hypothetical protein
MKKAILPLLVLSIGSNVAMAREFYSVDFTTELKYSSQTQKKKTVGHKMKGSLQVADDGAFPKVILAGQEIAASDVKIARVFDYQSNPNYLYTNRYAMQFKLAPETMKQVLEYTNSKPSPYQGQAAAIIDEHLANINGTVNFDVTVECVRPRGRGKRVTCYGMNSYQLHTDAAPEALHLNLLITDRLKVK